MIEDWRTERFGATGRGTTFNICSTLRLMIKTLKSSIFAVSHKIVSRLYVDMQNDVLEEKKTLESV